MRISVLKIALAVSLVFNLSVVGAAAYFYYSKSNYWVSPFGGVMKKDRFAFDALPLSEEQRNKLREGSRACRAEMDDKRLQIEARRAYLFTLMRAEKPDFHELKAAIADIGAIREEIEWLAVSRILEVKASLGKNQQTKYLDYIENCIVKENKTVCPSIMGRDVKH